MAPSIADDGGTVSIRQDGTLLARYRAVTEASKPHFDALALPNGAGETAGRNLVVASPHDHAWHFGLFFCQKLVDGINCWESELYAEDGRLHGVAESVDYEVVADDRVGVDHAVRWTSSEGEPLLDDERRVRVGEPVDGSYLLTWEGTLTALAETRHLSSETIHGHYSGLSVRFGRSMRGGRFRRSGADEATDDADSVDGTTSAWCDYTGKLDGKLDAADDWRAGATLMVDPVDAPTTWFAMNEPFGFLAANPTWGRVHALEAGESLSRRWGVWVHADAADRDDLRAAYRTFRERDA